MTGKIHALVFLGFAALAGSVAGCGSNCSDQRYATVAWNIVDDTTNTQLSCAAAGATDVLLFFGSSTPYDYACSDYQGRTAAGLQVGDYTTSMQLLDRSGAVLSDTAIPAGPSSFPILSCQPDDIPTVTFAVTF
jgi:hypothetical protein